jgi:hypothetical protein
MFAPKVAILRDKYLEIGHSIDTRNHEIDQIRVEGCREFPIKRQEAAFPVEMAAITFVLRRCTPPMG